jgi:uncharacterized membrane protein
MGFLASLPPTIRFFVWLLVGIIVLILIALVVSALGGFDWRLVVGHLHFDIGVDKK